MSGIMLRSLIPLDLSFVQDNRYGFICIILYVYKKFNQHNLFKMLSFPVYIPGTENVEDCGQELYMELWWHAWLGIWS